MPLEFLEELTVLSISNPLIVSAAVAALRSFMGWLENASADGKVTMFEIKQLVGTFLRVIPQSLGLAAFGIPEAGAFITDMVFSKLASSKKKK